ncbi:MAG: alpha/beta fold hydrolase [Kiloniellaceae bacterium]
MLDLPHRFDFRGRAVAWGSLGAGEPLVLLHGTPFSSQVWRRIAPLLGGRWKVHYFDLLGYGESAKGGDDDDVSLGVQNGLLAALCREWGLAEPEVLAHDFGGATALRAYYLDGLRYRRLTLVDPVAVAPWGSPFVAHVRAHEAAFAGLPAYAHDALVAAYLQTAAHRPLGAEALAVYGRPWQGALGQAAFYRQIAQMDQRYTDEIEGRYGPLDGPVRLLWGERDDWIPLERGRKLAARLTGGRLTPVPDAGHLVQEDAPEAIVAAMLS